MKMLKFMPVGLVLAVSLVGVSSASAANWDPQNTAITATQEGTSTLTMGGTFSCHSGDASIIASGATATLQSAEPVKFRNCTNSIISATTDVTTLGTWSFHAVDTTNVTATAIPPAGSSVVAHIVLTTPVGNCTIQMTGPVTITNNMWNNTTRTLSINNTVPFNLDSNATCLGGVTSTGRLDANYQLPVGVQIT